MNKIATLADTRAVEAEMPVERRWRARSLYQQLSETAEKFAERPAITFQLKSGPGDKAVTLNWRELRAEVTRMANLLRGLGIGPNDCVAYVLPNGVEAPVALLAGATAGIVVPVNPTLSPEHMGGILRETAVKVVITLKAFPKSDVAQKVAEALAFAPGVETVLEVDLRHYLDAPLRWIVPFVRPKSKVEHKARVLSLRAGMARADGDALGFEEADTDRVCACFHTGGTTGMPKVAMHRARGMLYNGWCGAFHLFDEKDVLICPLPMFHVLAAYPVFMSCLMSGAHMVMVTPQGYRGVGVFGNFWKLIARWKVSFLVMVPTAAAKLMQVPVDADISSLRLAICGSAPLPADLFHRFEDATGVKILEGYGMTEATCLVSINPAYGERRIGSVGLPFAYTDVRIFDCDGLGQVRREKDIDEVGEICVRGPGVNAETYADLSKNVGMMTPDGYLRTGDLGRIDADGYVWITGRAKDLIIRGGHNIDPAEVEEALISHPDVAIAGAIGQPDGHSGEVPAVYVELMTGSSATVAELLAHARAHVGEPAAMPKYLEVLAELPKTAVGKIFKPDLRRLAIARVYDAALERAGSSARVAGVVEDRRLGMVAELRPGAEGEEEPLVVEALAPFLIPWRWQRETGG